jgi:hypothetical protein
MLPPTPPVLLIIFNRADTTERVLSEIRSVRPRTLYVAADGPRPDMSADAGLCASARRVVEMIDWDCDIHRLYRNENLGAKRALASAITWFFDHEPEGVVLEHDCLPHPSFFRYCAELLARFRHDPRIMMIGGWNPLGCWKDDRQNYCFSTGGPWGWASWRRAWAHYDIGMNRWLDGDAMARLRSLLVHPRQRRAELRRFARVRSGQIETWDYQWRFARLVNGGLTVTPSRNLIRNIGFRPDAQHMRRPNSIMASIPVFEMTFPLRHPPTVALDQEFVARAHDFVHPRLPRRVWRRLTEYGRAWAGRRSRADDVATGSGA